MDLALLVTLVGLTVVFASLVILFFVISLFPKIAKIRMKPKATEITNDNNASIVKVENKEPEACNTSFSYDELVAVLTAAVQASMVNRPDCKLVVKSFRRITQSSPVWNVVGRDQQIAAKL